MSDPRWIIAIVIVVVVLAFVAWMIMKNRRQERLRTQFGPEYPRAVRKYGSVARAESALEERRERVRRLDIRPLRLEEADRFAATWRTTQARFVDDPAHAIAEADRLVQAVMDARGYPVADFEQRVEDISVDHPRVVEHYLAAHQIAMSDGKGQADTEELRQAMMHYRVLFDDLLDVVDEGPRRMEAGR